LKRAHIFLFATLAAAVISVVLPMNLPPQRPSSHRSDAPFVPAAGIPQIISIISSG
jgi:hypothetical protein